MKMKKILTTLSIISILAFGAMLAKTIQVRASSHDDQEENETLEIEDEEEIDDQEELDDIYEDESEEDKSPSPSASPTASPSVSPSPSSSPSASPSASPSETPEAVVEENTNDDALSALSNLIKQLLQFIESIGQRD